MKSIPPALQLVVKESVKTSDGYVLKAVSYNYRVCVVGKYNQTAPHSSDEVILTTKGNKNMNRMNEDEMTSNDRDQIIKSIDRLLTDITEYRDHCYCMESYQVVDLLDTTIKTIEILNKMIDGKEQC